jgi:glycine C-acetyltransferase
MAFVDEELGALKEKGLYRKLSILEGEQRPRAVIDGRAVINLSANNYLGFSTHPKLKEAAHQAIDKYGVGAGAAREIVGTMDVHEELERKLAEFKHTEAALVFATGCDANEGVIGTLLSDRDVVISDELNHASIIDGIRLTKADREIYAHLNMDGLRQVLEKVRAKGYRNILVVSDGVFSMDGEVAPFGEIAALGEEYGAIVMVDEAHATGVLGDHGRGIANHFGVEGRLHIQMGTLSKALGAVGGYIACSQGFRELMEHKARPFLFSTAPPPAVMATCIAALDLLTSDEGGELVARLWENTDFFKTELNALGFDTGKSQTPITPVMVGEGDLAMRFGTRLFEEGVFATGIAYPTVPRGKARLRTIVSAQHSRDDLDAALQIFEHVGKELGLV